MRRLPVAQFTRFVAVGVLNTSFSYMVYAIGLAFGFHFAFANLIAMVSGTLFSFVTQGRLVFNHRGFGRYGRFLSIWVCIWLFNVALVGALMAFLDIGAYVAGAIALVPMVVLSFALQRLWVFAPVTRT
jgi:putative flippase GtrA